MEAANPPKRRYASTKIRGDTFHKTGICQLTNITTFMIRRRVNWLGFTNVWEKPAASRLYPKNGGSKCPS
jgi:hypothetical protein